MAFADERVLRPYRMPCKDCQKRQIGCHSQCTEYAEAVAEKDRARADTERAKMKDDLNYRYLADAVTKARRKRNL